MKNYNSTKISILMFGIVLLAFITFMFNNIPIKEICNCSIDKCTIHQIYLTKTNDKVIQRNIHPYLKVSTLRNYIKYEIVKIVDLYKVSPVFDSDYMLKCSANKAISIFNKNETFVLVKYNVPYILAFFIILSLIMLPLIIELLSKYEKANRMGKK